MTYWCTIILIIDGGDLASHTYIPYTRAHHQNYPIVLSKMYIPANCEMLCLPRKLFYPFKKKHCILLTNRKAHLQYYYWLINKSSNTWHIKDSHVVSSIVLLWKSITKDNTLFVKSFKFRHELIIWYIMILKSIIIWSHENGTSLDQNERHTKTMNMLLSIVFHALEHLFCLIHFFLIHNSPFIHRLIVLVFFSTEKLFWMWSM